MTERSCRVCGCTNDRACVRGGVACHWLAQQYPGDDLCSACEPARNHVVAMTRGPHAERVGHCQCGFNAIVIDGPGADVTRELLVQTHLRVVCEAA